MRRAGVLLHISSLPSRWGIGDFGPESLRFASFLCGAGLSVWQLLPVTPAEQGMGNSPYSPPSAFAGNFLYISPERLIRAGYLDDDDPDLLAPPVFPEDKVDFPKVREFKRKLLHKAFKRFKKGEIGHCFEDYEHFFRLNQYWVESWSFFAALKKANNGKPWYEWEKGLKFRTHEALHQAWLDHRGEIEYERFVQFIFYQQVKEFRQAVNDLGVQLVGDVPIYTTLDSSDVWVSPHLFQLDKDLRPTFVAGVPPDYFSETGQLWGNPLYNWDAMTGDYFAWWRGRLRHALLLFDCLRIDHFRGLVGYWAVPAGDETAENGSWRAVPRTFFNAIRDEFPGSPFWAENLGILTDDVTAVMREMNFPGMIVMHFAWSGTPTNSYAPHNHTGGNVVYTGTHDNNTTRGWFADDASKDERESISAYTGRDIDEKNVCEEMIRLALSSVADTAVVPMQDFLELGSEARFNKPSTPSGNWAWRMSPGAADKTLAREILKKVKTYGRSRA